MADGKNIEIRIAATGGDQAAAEIKKVDSAAESLGGGGRKAAAEMEGFTRSGNAVSASSVRMRGNIQNVAFQFQDMAVQAEMGVSAVRIFSQQVPQLLGGFGALGAVAGAVVGIGVPLAAALLGAGKAAEDSKEKVDAFNEILEDHAEMVKNAAAEKAKANTEEWLEALDEEEGYYDRINSRLERQVALQTKLQALKSGADSAEREAQIAAIEADPNKSESEKIKAVAAIREQDAKAKADAKKTELANAAALAEKQAAEAQAKADRQAADAAAASQRRADLEAKQAALEAKTVAGAEAGKNLPKLEGDLAAAERGAAFAINPETGETMPGYAKFQQDIERLKAEIAAAKKAAADAITAAKDRGTVGAEVDAAKTGEKKQQDEARAARDAVENAAGKSATAAALAREGSPQIDRQYEAEKQQRQRREETALRQAEEKAKQEEAKRKIEEAKAKAEAAQEAVDQRGRGVGAEFKNRGRNAPKGKAQDLLMGIGDKLSDDTSAKEIESLKDQLTKAAEGTGSATVATLQALLSAMLEQAKNAEAMKKEVEALQAQIKKGRTK